MAEELIEAGDLYFLYRPKVDEPRDIPSSRPPKESGPRGRRLLKEEGDVIIEISIIDKHEGKEVLERYGKAQMLFGFYYWEGSGHA